MGRGARGENAYGLERLVELLVRLLQAGQAAILRVKKWVHAGGDGQDQRGGEGGVVRGFSRLC